MCRQCESFLVEAKWCFSDHFCILEVHLLSKMWLCFFFSGWLLRIELSEKQYFHSDFSLFVIFIIRWQTTLHSKNPLKMPVKKWAKTLLWQKKAGRRLTDKDNAKTSSFLPVTKTISSLFIFRLWFYLTYCIAFCDSERGLVTLLFRITELYVTIIYKCYL